METENQEPIGQDNAHEMPPDSDLFVGRIHEELSEQEVFAGDEDFFKTLTDSAQAGMIQPELAGINPNRHPLALIWQRFSTLQKILIVGIVLVAVPTLSGLFYALKSPATSNQGYAGPPDAKTPVSDQTPAVLQTTSSRQSPAPGEPVKDHSLARQQVPKPDSVITPTQPISLKVAQTLYLQKDYEKAYAAYNLLRQNLPKGGENQLLRDFLQLKIALAAKKKADTEQAERLLRTILTSRSPMVRAMANYHLTSIDLQKKLYLRARTRAYQVIALINAIDYESDWALQIKQDCHFLVSELITRRVLSLCDSDKDIPDDLWRNNLQDDPFDNLNQAQLKSLLKSGLEKFNKAVLGPQIQRISGSTTSTLTRWLVICSGASIEEILSRFAADSNLDIHWAFDGTPAMEETKNIVRKRPVTLYLPMTTNQQFLTVATGCAGLLARSDEKNVINIFDPADYSSLSQYISLLSDEAFSLWKKFLLRFSDARNIPNAHFALALLHAQKNQMQEALAEFKLLVNKFPGSSLVPSALLHSSRLKSSLHDYFGAREDLIQLVEQYPDAEITGKAYLHLADATMKAQIYHEAGKLYCKVYNISLSSDLQIASALGAGRCFYEKQEYTSAQKWLTRYIGLIKDPTNNDLYSAYFLLGKTYLALGKSQQACDAFQYALTGRLGKEEYVETILALVNSYMEQENFIKALAIVENIHSWQLSQKEAVKISLLKSRIYREMGLVHKAVAALTKKAEHIFDAQLKAQISFELTNCYIARKDWQFAYKNLQMLVFVEPGPLANRISCKLAQVCLEIGKNSQAVSVCSQLLDTGPSEQIRKQTLEFLAEAHKRQKNYDKAALALLGYWKETEVVNENIAFNNLSLTTEALVKTQ